MFKKGQKVWNKGKKSPWTSKRNRENNPMKNSVAREKMIRSKTGKAVKHSGSFKKGHIPWNKGKKCDKVTKQKISLSKGGSGRTKSPRNFHSLKYKNWRTAVFTRDSFTCQICKQVGIDLEAHHIKGWIKYPRLRFNISNGITLCKECHKLVHKLYGRKQT